MNLGIIDNSKVKIKNCQRVASREVNQGQEPFKIGLKIYM